MLRRGWGLEGILRELAPAADADKKGKPRTDHRHHAIDAITIALSRPKLIAALSRANERDQYWPKTGRRFPRIDAPWKDFVDSIRPEIEQMLVSIDRSIGLPAHCTTKQTTASAKRRRQGCGSHPQAGCRTFRRGIERLSIASARPFAPRQPNSGAVWKNGRRTKHKMTGLSLEQRLASSYRSSGYELRKAVKVFPVGGDAQRTRYVAPGADSIHHIAVFAAKDRRGRDKWISDIVGIFEFKERWATWQKSGAPVAPLIYKTHSKDADAEFLFT